MAVKRAYGTPGGYIGREKVRKYNAILLGYFAYSLVVTLVCWAASERLGYATPLWGFLVLVPVSVGVARRSTRDLMRPWFAGLTGEREIAKQLRPLLHAGYDVLHDVDLGRGNVDHVVVGPSGIYAIETKAWSGRFHLGRGGRLMRSGFSAESVRKQAVASAAAVTNRLAMCGLDSYAIAVVALARSTLPLGPMNLRHAYVVDGPSLAMWIARRPTKLGTHEIERARVALVPYVA